MEKDKRRSDPSRVGNNGKVGIHFPTCLIFFLFNVVFTEARTSGSKSGEDPRLHAATILTATAPTKHHDIDKDKFKAEHHWSRRQTMVRRKTSVPSDGKRDCIPITTNIFIVYFFVVNIFYL